MSDQRPGSDGESTHQPIFLIPGVILSLVGLAVAVQLASTLVLNPAGQAALYDWFGFVPYRLVAPEQFPGGWLPLIWTPITYAFLHGGWEHLVGNMAWLAIFGTPVARRYGTGRTLMVFFVSSVVGAVAFGATAFSSPQWLVGASGGIAGFTGAAIRFMFQPVIVAPHPVTGAPVPLGRRLATPREVWANPTARSLSLLWIVLNCVVPLAPLVTGEQVGIAWQAHLGGFFAGFFLLSLFDHSDKLPAPPPPAPPASELARDDSNEN
jgi:membrane associated rhomboid family serine protease